MSGKDKSSHKKKPKHTKEKVKADSSKNHILSDLDLHLLGEGNHFKSYEKLGSKIRTVKKKKGAEFTVWAPNAKSVSVVGEFNEWKAESHKMNKIAHSGYWELFIPGIKEGDIYKYAVKQKSGETVFKSDPYAFRCELRPNNASVVESLNRFEWNDKQWLKDRKKLDTINNSYKKKPISVYEVHPGSWKKDFDNTDFRNEWGYKNYRQLAHELAGYVKEMNYTHIELLPVMEHPLDISWGYQVVNYYAPTSRYGSPEDFMYFVDYMHQNNIGVILDWVPSHFPTDEHGLGRFDGKEIYAYENPMKGFHNDWGTYVFDYGRNEVSNFLISNALFWFEKYHIDGLRVDAVASMLYLDYSRNEGEWQPNIYGGNENLEAVDFLKKLNSIVHRKHKGILMIAEESSTWPGVTAPVHLGGLGFDLKWNMGWMHDILAYFSMDPVFRKFHHGKLTFTIWYAFSEKFLLPVSHDEVVHLKKSVIEKMPGDIRHKFANARLLFGLMFAHPGKKLNFMGNDIAQYQEWNSEVSLTWEVLDYELNKKFHYYFKELGKLYREHTPFYEVDFESRGFQWIDFSDSDNSVIAFVRYNSDKSRMLLFTFNMTPVQRENYKFGVPRQGFYQEIFNSNAEEFGGSGTGNLGGVYSEDIPGFDFPYSVRVTLPPLAVNVYNWEKPEAVKEFKVSFDVVGNETDKGVTETPSSGESGSLITVKENTEEEIQADENMPDETAAETDETASSGTENNLRVTEIITSDNEEDSGKTSGKETGIKTETELTEDEMEENIKKIIGRIKKF
ncbi:MAG: 1,4-alpha-glucan branching protein GlgB [Ignavibacteria bacterium]|nr:1,4-alpha-glucan branching protein GlgB [Ignavibacteria bacterium]